MESGSAVLIYYLAWYISGLAFCLSLSKASEAIFTDQIINKVGYWFIRKAGSNLASSNIVISIFQGRYFKIGRLFLVLPSPLSTFYIFFLSALSSILVTTGSVFFRMDGYDLYEGDGLAGQSDLLLDLMEFIFRKSYQIFYILVCWFVVYITISTQLTLSSLRVGFGIFLLLSFILYVLTYIFFIYVASIILKILPIEVFGIIELLFVLNEETALLVWYFFLEAVKGPFSLSYSLFYQEGGYRQSYGILEYLLLLSSIYFYSGLVAVLLVQIIVRTQAISFALSNILSWLTGMHFRLSAVGYDREPRKYIVLIATFFWTVLFLIISFFNFVFV